MKLWLNLNYFKFSIFLLFNPVELCFVLLVQKIVRNPLEHLQ